MPVVTMPDGVPVSFPDEMPPEQIRDLIAKKFPDQVRSLGNDPAIVPPGTTGVEDVGRGTALGLGLVQGASANFGDEMAGVMAAAGKPVQAAGLAALPATAIKGAGKLAYEYLTGGKPTLSGLITGETPKGEATQRYEEMRDRVRELAKSAEEQYPGTYIAGQAGGAIISPASKARALAKGATLLQRTGNVAAAGGRYGTAAGLGEGEDLGDRAARGAVGGVGGYVLGGALNPALEGAGKVIMGAGKTIASPFSAISTYLNPDRAAARTVAGAINKARETGDRTALPQADYDRLVAAGEPVSTMELAGDAGRNLARRVRNEPGAFGGRQEIQDVVNERFLGQGSRFADDVERLSVGNRRIDTEDLRASASPINNINYRAAHQQADAAISSAIDQGATRPFLTDRFKTLLQSPIAQRALAPAAEREANRTIVEGAKQARKFPLVAERTEAGNVKVSLRESQTGKSTSVFDLHAIDSISRALRDFAGAAERSGNRELSRDVTVLRKAWLQEADKLVPAYAKARGEAFKRFKAEDAFEAGQNFVKRVGKMGDREFALAQKEIAGWSQTEKELFKRGGGQELSQWLRSLPENQDVVPKLLNSDAARRQMEMLFGAPAVRRLEARKRVEQIMEWSHKAVSGNSTTAFQLALERGGLASLGGAGIGGGYALLSGDNPLTSAAIVSGLMAGNKRLQLAVNAKVLDKVGKMLASNDPTTYQRALNMVVSNQKLFNAIRQISQQIERAGAGTAGSEAAGPISQRVPLMIGRASEEDQPVR